MKEVKRINDLSRLAESAIQEMIILMGYDVCPEEEMDSLGQRLWIAYNAVIEARI